MMNQRVWEQSGHWDHYKDNMYFTNVDDTKYALKPMNCPGHMLIFKNKLRSYRDLPLRISEFGQVHRHEFSGALNGMLRVRTFCQDDAHLFVLPSQIEEEIGSIIELIDNMYQVFGFEYKIELSTRPEDSMGSDELWEEAERALQNVLDRRGIDYRINEGDGAFYGPKIDFTFWTRSSGAGSAARFSWISKCPENTISLTSAKTARNIARSSFTVRCTARSTGSWAC
ncbi:Threonine--tRNA ligase 2 [Paenibacillus sp. P1XP2]|nr:Threonine--tRNA ligase 2 [Paenibacillus sp. P1XP2]